LREIIDDRTAARRPSWDDAQDALLTLLRADAFGTDLALRRIAIGTCADWIIALADRLAKAAAAEPPSSVTLTVNGHAVEVTMEGQASLGAAYAEIEQENAPQGVSDKLFGKKHAAEEIERAKGWVSTVADGAAAALVQRGAELRTAARQAATDRDAIAAALRP
jgi:hypothetical protein